MKESSSDRNANEIEYEQWMKYALDLAHRGAGHVSPNPMVGAVIVLDGKIIAEGYHTRYGSLHAEVEALNAAYQKGLAGKMADATLFVTLEPCCHHGKQPPCTEAILKSGIGHVVVAMLDPNPQVSGKGIGILVEAGVHCEIGILEKDAIRLNASFVKSMSQKSPYVLLKSAVSLDGAMASHLGDSKWISSVESRTEVHRLRHEMDAVMVGIGTALADDPSLDVRMGVEEIKELHGHPVNPRRIIVDSNARLPVDAKVLSHDDGKTVVAVTIDPSGSDVEKDKRIENLMKSGAKVLVCRMESSTGQIDLNDLMDKLFGMGICSILLEGGSTLSGKALSQGIVDRVRLYQAPVFLGESHYRMTSGFKADHVSEGIRLVGVTVRQVGGDTVIEGDIQPCSQES